MPRDGAIIFGDPIAKLDMLRVACDKCGRKGRDAKVLASVIHHPDGRFRTTVDFGPRRFVRF
jgi:hypothetical protein